MTIRPVGFGAVCLALVVCACGGDDDKQVVADDGGGDGGGEAGAPALVTFPPAIGPEDCVVSTSEITLSQPEGAAVWGGLVLLEFEVEGAKVDAFDIQVYDPALGAWVTSYVSQNAAGQRDDGSYFMAISPIFNDANKDQELAVRVRPSQQGCPEAEWTETEPFTAGNPLVGTSWSAVIPSALFNSRINLQRNLVPEGTSLEPLRMALGDATLLLEFGAKGAFSETVSFSLETEEGAAYHGCTISLTFAGTYELILRQQYGGMMLAISDQLLEGSEGTTCDLPTVEEMTFSVEGFDTPPINAYTQGVSINYLPTLYSEPGAASWSNSGFGQIFEQLMQFLSYATATEFGSPNGYLYPLDLNLQQQ